MLTNQNIYDAFKAYKKDISDLPIDTFVQWCNFCLTFVYLKLANSSPDMLRKTQTYTIGGGITSITLPADFKQMGNFENGLYLTDSNGSPNVAITMGGYAAPYFSYYLTPTTLEINKGPTQTQAAILRYTPMEPQFTALSDYWTLDKTITGAQILDFTALEYLVRAVDVQYTMWDEDISMEPVSDQRFVRILSEMLSRLRNSPNSYSLNFITGAF